MNWKSIAKSVGQAAPLLGTVLAGPAGGAVGSLIASGLGVDGNPESVAAALSDPDTLVRLKQIEADHRAELESMAVDLAKAELRNQEQAREIHKHSPMPMVVTGALTMIFAAALYMMFNTEIPDANRDLAYVMLGQLSALWGASVTFWVGTTRSSAEKTRLMAGK
ncbi:hypothetical protein [Zhongshania sp.]|jgi:hypothetical protein|uniref:hypothetical protein n=1 Tax=Zhongshania sp. TaxID=1971902 RepID=UPI002A8234C4|nr:hypothetical protein [Zhongshania sp.]